LAQPTEQSPIAISRSSTVRDPNPPQIDFNYGIVNVKLTNTYGNKDETGRVLAQEWGALKAYPDAGPEVRLNGIPYDLIQFHFHTPSEHTVNGRRTDMEVHLVHLIRSQGPEAACASSNRPLVVIGVFIDAAGNSDRELQRLFPPGLPRNSTDPYVNVPSVDLHARPGACGEPGLALRRRLDGARERLPRFQTGQHSGSDRRFSRGGTLVYLRQDDASAAEFD
jgi:carbonic anhydrase